MSEGKQEQASIGGAGCLRSALSRGWLFGLLLVAATLLAYLPALPGKFVWDDDSWTTKISGLLRDASGLWTMWCKPTALQQYYPLTGTTFWLDYHLWGFWTLPYHVENVLLHALAALLFWRLLRRLQVPGAWLAAAIFALHPVMVESAGWITERKNVLSLVFYLGALLAYGRFAGFLAAAGPDCSAAANCAPTSVGGLWVGLAAVCGGRSGEGYGVFTAGGAVADLLVETWAHPVAGGRAAEPAVLCRRRSAWVWSRPGWKRHSVGAKGPEWAFSFPERCLIAGRALWFYTGKLLWPANLCFVYPRWHLDAGSFVQWLYPVHRGGRCCWGFG